MHEKQLFESEDMGDLVDFGTRENVNRKSPLSSVSSQFPLSSLTRSIVHSTEKHCGVRNLLFKVCFLWFSFHLARERSKRSEMIKALIFN